MKGLRYAVCCGMLAVSLTQNVYAAEVTKTVAVSQQTNTANSVEEWKNIINSANEKLLPSVKVRIYNFDKTSYDLSGVLNYYVSISAKGTANSKYADITYTFTYSTNYKMLRALEDGSVYYRLSQSEKDALEKAKTIVNSITSSTMTNYEKELAIHDYLILNSTYYTSEDGVIPEEAHNMTMLLNEGRGVCEAYAHTFKLMCQMAGVECELMTGTVDDVGHMWNRVKLDNFWYQVDVTSDDPIPDEEGRVMYKYFNATDAQMLKTHSWDTNVYKACYNTKYNYYQYNNLVATNATMLKGILKEALQNGQTKVHFMTKGYIINSSAVIAEEMRNSGYSSIKVYGEYGSEGCYVVEFIK